LLSARRRDARAFALSVIAIEEASKIPYLVECAEKIIAGEAPNRADVHKFLNSHQQS
jgi:AbiV family abortive infection protein